MAESRAVSTASELVSALESGALDIEVRGTIAGMPMITLGAGVTLRGGTLRFGAKGVRLTRDNTLVGVTVITAEDEVAILNDTSVTDFGTLALRGVRTCGQVLLLATDAVTGGHVEVDGLHIDRADVRGRVDRPRGFGVEALQGAFTLWNRQAEPGVVLSADLRGIGAGSAQVPIRGSGVFVAGHGNPDGIPDGGTVHVLRLTTGEIHTDGGIPAGTPDLISGGVFVVSGAIVDQVLNTAPVTTHGQNDMVLDNWGRVDEWTATAPVTSNGPSGIGFVNFGRIGHLDIQAPIQTFGTGARGFNLYDGTLEHARFASITTHGDGSVGVQVSKPLPRLEITGDLTTAGGEGQSLVKGVQIALKAIALSVKPGAVVDSITVGGQIRTTGGKVITVEIDGIVGQLDVAGGISAHGPGSDAVHVKGDVPGLDATSITAAQGRGIVRT